MDKVVMEFLEENNITCFKVPANIIVDNAKDFSSSYLSIFCFNDDIVLSHSSNYYPQGNGLSKANNKNLMTIIKKMVGDNHKSWENKIKYVLCDDRITKKDSTGKRPFELVYKMDVTLDVHLEIRVYKIM
jgi:hypothetical protein